jgi:hypothetical protein
MKRILPFVLLLSLVLPVLAFDGQWKELKSTHFIVYYKSAPEKFVSDASQSAEYYYNRISADLGFRRFDFWLWDNRAKIYIFDDAADYQNEVGLPAWSAASTIASKKIIRAYPGIYGFLENILPHEMGHIIFRELVGFDNPAVPLWLDEGVASLQQRDVYYSANFILKNEIHKGSLLDLNALSSYNLYASANTHSVSLFYSEAYSIVTFLISKYGRDKFQEFCQALRDKRDFDRALSSAYNIESGDELNLLWQETIKK